MLLDGVVGTSSSGPVIASSGSTVPQAPPVPLVVGGDAAGTTPFPAEPVSGGSGGPGPSASRRSEPRVWPVALALGMLGLLLGGGLTMGVLDLGEDDSQLEARGVEASGVPVAAPAAPNRAAAAPDVDGGAPSDAAAAVDPALAVAAVPAEVVDEADGLEDEAETEPDLPADEGDSTGTAGPEEPTDTTDADEPADPMGATDQPAEADADDAAPDDVEPSPVPRAKARPKPAPAPRVDVHARLTLVDEVELRIGTTVRRITGDKTIRMRTGSKRLSVRVPGSRTWNSTTVRLEPGRSYLLRLYSKRVELTPLGGARR